jgi:threonine synthase
VECFILFPEGRVSPIQQMQMTSVLDPNVHCVAVQGTFDDCQDIVKALFRDRKSPLPKSFSSSSSPSFSPSLSPSSCLLALRPKDVCIHVRMCACA